LDANWGFGQVMARRAMEMAVEKARAKDIGLASIRNCNHIGRVGEYPEIAAEHEMVGIAMCNGGGEVSPYGSIDPIYGTCPISIAIPTGGRPILLDMATSVVAGGKIALAIANNEEIPLGWIIDSKGHPTSDPYDLGTSRPAFAEKPSKAKGALLPFGSYKGSGIGLFVEIMGGVLAGAGTGEEGRGNGVVMMAIDIGKFSPIEEFKGKVDRLIRMVKSSRKDSGVEEILVAGEPEYKNMERRLREGIYVDDATWRSIKKTAQEFNVSYSS
nr:malate dehydrogenase [Nitrososphaeria archaeon]NIQ32325.1 malate dehydrogenase [Nitrososphaeria archaeon]